MKLNIRWMLVVLLFLVLFLVGCSLDSCISTIPGMVGEDVGQATEGGNISGYNEVDIDLSLIEKTHNVTVTNNSVTVNKNYYSVQEVVVTVTPVIDQTQDQVAVLKFLGFTEDRLNRAQELADDLGR